MSNLVLMRRPGESIVLNEEITIVEIHNQSRVRVAINALPTVSIRRSELVSRAKTSDVELPLQARAIQPIAHTHLTSLSFTARRARGLRLTSI